MESRPHYDDFLRGKCMEVGAERAAGSSVDIHSFPERRRVRKLWMMRFGRQI
jgi:hypothetical protein